MDDTSSFLASPVEPGNESTSQPQLIHSSGAGYCDLYRIDRQGRFRVLKCLKPSYRGKELYERLLRKEFEIGYSLNHPHIAEYYAFQNTDLLGNCIEMEWIDGRTLEELLASDKPDNALAEKLADELCDALSYIHSKQVIHRDLKPSNILVTHTGNTVKLIDFGFSDSDAHSILKISAGTAVYTAPEVLKGEEANVRSDIYSLGLILSQISRGFRRVARKCCEPRPWRRYASAAEVKKAIHSRWPLFSGVLFILAVTAIVLLPYVSKWLPGEEVIPIIPADTAVVTTPADTAKPVSHAPDRPSAPVKKKEGKPAREETVDEAAIDELFRQATELFD